jgi:hypothetical protein
MTYHWSKPTRYHREACDAVGKVARIVADTLDRLRRPGGGHPKWQEVETDAKLVTWQPSTCAERGLKGPDSYVLAPGAADCGAEDNVIRRKLCLVKQQMRQGAQPGPAAELRPGAAATVM